jgi:D-sedoheptulose 7-phosphate isomerase
MLTQHIEELQKDLQTLTVHEAALMALSDAVLQAFNNGGKLLTCGNGGSAAEAAHLAEEFTGRFYRERKSLPGICLSIDGTLLTCIGNDYGFDDIFSRQVQSLGMPHDILIIFSSSGNSENIVRALKAAKERGVVTGAFLGKTGGKCIGLADHEIIVQSVNPSAMRIQECHQLMIHALCERVEVSLLGIGADQ